MEGTLNNRQVSYCFFRLTAAESIQLAIAHKKAAHTQLKILVVEDDKINQYVAKISLQNMGYTVDIAEDGKTALSLYKSNTYSAILMDIGLPDIDGREVTRTILQYEKETKKPHTPIIGLTAGCLDIKAECLAAGMDSFMLKPFMFNELEDLLRKLITD